MKTIWDQSENVPNLRQNKMRRFHRASMILLNSGNSGNLVIPLLVQVLMPNVHRNCRLRADHLFKDLQLSLVPDPSPSQLVATEAKIGQTKLQGRP